MGGNASGGGLRLKQNSNDCVAQTAFKSIITMDNQDLSYTNSATLRFHSYQNQCVLWDSKVGHERFYCFSRLQCMIQNCVGDTFILKTSSS